MIKNLGDIKISKAKLLEGIEMPNMPQAAKMSSSEIKAMSDGEIKAILTWEKAVDGLLSVALQNALTIELSERALKKASKPHWSVNYNFWATVIAAVASCVAVGLTIYQIRSSQPVIVVQQLPVTTQPVQNAASSSKQQLLHTQPKSPTKQQKKP